jgi:hypothetical protein|tara:strand:- start:548 stop:772 length:225 start_codon:yes stop_codon:yes gene_type:complete
MLNKLPKELHNHVLDYAFGCRKDQNFYVNKEVVIYISEKCNKCKKIIMFNKPICYGCYEKEIKQVYYMFSMIGR